VAQGLLLGCELRGRKEPSVPVALSQVDNAVVEFFVANRVDCSNE
jgi:hypothetical protein